MRCGSQWMLALACVAGAAGALPDAARAQQAGTITGRVSDAVSGQPIPSAQVSVVGTNLGALTNEQGRYTVRGVPARQVTVRVLRVGYTEQTQAVTVAAGATATADIAVRQTSVTLTPVVTTATGETRRVEVGNAIAQVNAAEVVERSPIRNITDLLTARAPGVQVVPGTLTGTGARVRIRGTTSLSLSNDPIYVIDGVRMTSSTGSSSLGVGGSLPSRVGDINPDEIESIEVVKGPSAATLYGTDAANGVIVLTTKRGRAGRTRLNSWVEQGLIQDRNEYPSNYTLQGTRPGQTAIRNCVLAEVAAGTCVNTALRAYNLLEDDDVSPLTNGSRQQYGLSLSGGTEAVRYFTSGEYEREVATLYLPPAEQRRFADAGIPVSGRESRPNALNRSSFRGNLNAQPWPTLDLAVSTNFINLNQRLPQTDDNVMSLYFNALGGPGFRDTAATNGYRTHRPGEIFQLTTSQTVNRFIGSTNASWRPTTWLSGRANVGLDFAGRIDQNLCRRGSCPNFSIYRQGFGNDNRTNIRNVSADVGGTASFQPLPWLTSKTTLGTQYVNYRFDANYAAAEILPPGAQTITAGSTKFASQGTTVSKTLGFFVEESVALRDRLFLTGALRSDQNSAFGTDFQRVVYPKASLSYVVSEEGYFPRPGWLDQLRVRAAYGASGQQPNPNDAARYYVASSSSVSGTDAPTLQFSALGNQGLKPERAAEFEGGFDARLFGSRVSLELTYYSKMSRDALIAQVIPPTVGSGATTRFVNIGAVKNAGLEGLLQAQLVSVRQLGWDVALNGSTNRNKLVTLGDVPPVIGNLQSQKPGYPLNGWWHRRITGYEDKNGDGIIAYNANPSLSELTVGDTAEFLGYAAPRHEVTLTNGLDLLNRTLRIQAMFDYKGGHKVLNDTERFRCDNFANCRGRTDASAPLWEQARTVARTIHPSFSWDGFIEKADYVRFRELSLTYSPPSRLAARFLRTDQASVSLSARNLALWTDYTGIDPEANYISNGEFQANFFTMPTQTYLTLRVNLGF
jgi:TonB-linked SusC/RagA family outer membrane protein